MHNINTVERALKELFWNLVLKVVLAAWPCVSQGIKFVWMPQCTQSRPLLLSVSLIHTESATVSTTKSNGSKTDRPARKALKLCPCVWVWKLFFVVGVVVKICTQANFICLFFQLQWKVQISKEKSVTQNIGSSRNIFFKQCDKSHVFVSTFVIFICRQNNTEPFQAMLQWLTIFSLLLTVVVLAQAESNGRLRSYLLKIDEYVETIRQQAEVNAAQAQVISEQRAEIAEANSKLESLNSKVATLNATVLEQMGDIDVFKSGIETLNKTEGKKVNLLPCVHLWSPPHWLFSYQFRKILQICLNCPNLGFVKQRSEISKPHCRPVKRQKYHLSHRCCGFPCCSHILC